MRRTAATSVVPGNRTSGWRGDFNHAVDRCVQYQCCVGKDSSSSSSPSSDVLRESAAGSAQRAYLRGQTARLGSIHVMLSVRFRLILGTEPNHTRAKSPRRTSARTLIRDISFQVSSFSVSSCLLFTTWSQNSSSNYHLHLFSTSRRNCHDARNHPRVEEGHILRRSRVCGLHAGRPLVCAQNSPRSLSRQLADTTGTVANVPGQRQCKTYRHGTPYTKANGRGGNQVS